MTEQCGTPGARPGLMPVLLCFLACTQPEPRLEPWNLPVADPGLLSNRVRTICAEPGDRALWLGTNEGASRYDLETGSFTTYTTEDGLASNCVGGIIAEPGGAALWLATLGGASRYDLETGNFTTYTNEDYGAFNLFNAIFAEPGGTALWLTTNTGRAARYDLESGDFTTYSPGILVWAILAEPGGAALWFGGYEGASRYDLETGRFTTYTTEDGLASNDVRAIFAEPGGTALWFGNWGGGASRYDLVSGRFTTYTTEDGLAGNDVSIIFAEPGGAALWLGNWGGGVTRYDLETGRFTTYTRGDGLASNDVSVIFAEPGGAALWLGTYTYRGGASRYDLETGRFTTYSTEDGLRSNDVRAIFAEPGGAALWLGTLEGGASRYDLETGGVTTYTTEDGLADNSVSTIYAEPGEAALWLGTYEGGASRYDLESGRFTTYTTEDGLRSNEVRDISAEPRGAALWLGTSEGATRYDLETRRFTTCTTEDGLADNFVWAIFAEPGGAAVWFGTSEGASRYDLQTQRFMTYTTEDGLAGNNVQAIFAEPGGAAMWLGRSRVVLGGEGANGEAGAVINLTSLEIGDRRHLLAGNPIGQSRPRGISFITGTADRRHAKAAVAGQHQILEVASAPHGRAWVATRLGGLRLSGPEHHDLHLTKTDGLPSMDVNSLALVPSSHGRTVWAGTAGGAARVTLDDGKLAIQRTATWEDDLPTGPVNALAALADGSVFLAYNAIAPKLILDPELAKRRARTHVRYVPSEGPPATDPIDLPDVEIRQLAFTPEKRFLGFFVIREETLWAATSAGLYQAVRPREPDARFEPVTPGGALAAPLHTVKTQDDGTLWVITRPAEDVPPAVIGYRPAAEETVSMTDVHGIPAGPRIDDLDFTTDGELVVMVGGRLVKGRITIPGGGIPWTLLQNLIIVLTVAAAGGWIAVRRHPLCVRLREHPDALGELSFSRIPTGLRLVGWSFARSQVREQLGFSAERMRAIGTLAVGAPDARRLRTLAALLGMDDARAASVEELPRVGLRVLAARLPDPEPLRGRTTSLVGVDPAAAPGVDPAAVRQELARVLDELQPGFELPFLILCRDPAAVRELIPEGRVALIVGDQELRRLLFAPSPRQLLAGLLLTRDLLALSPYRPEGAVRSAAMFYGRGRLLRELMTADPLHFLLVGPRRVGKSSVLRRLREDLRVVRPELPVVHLDLGGVSEPGRVLRKLASRLALPEPAAGDDPARDADLLTSLLTEGFAGRPGVLLIDEADALVRIDAGRGHPLLSALRTLEAEGVCGCVLAGYWDLYRRTLDHSSPLYNFAPVRRLGPLDPESGRDLAREPMGRLGLRWSDPSLPVRVCERSGGYPNLIQLVCDQLLAELREGRSLTLTADHLDRAERGSRVRDYLVESFAMNTLPASQVMVDGLLVRERFTTSEAHGVLEEAVGREVPIGVLDELLVQLVLYGFARRSGDGYEWTIPLLREALLTAPDREYRIRRRVSELGTDALAWVMASDLGYSVPPSSRFLRGSDG